MNEKLLKVYLSDETVVQCSENHAFLMASVWKTAKDLKEGDRIQATSGVVIIKEVKESSKKRK